MQIRTFTVCIALACGATIAGCGGGATIGSSPTQLGVTAAPNQSSAPRSTPSPTTMQTATPTPTSSGSASNTSAIAICQAPALTSTNRSRRGDRRREATIALPVSVVGPIPTDAPGSPSHNYPWMATDVDLASNGYVEEEYFFCGTSQQGGGTYTTRMIVRRPATAKNFNGVVLAEWLNTTTDVDLDILWSRSNAHIMRAGYAYVGISVQREGYYASPYGLALWSPKRYAQLNWPGGAADGAFNTAPDDDPAAYDILTQALQALRARNGADPLGGLSPKYVIATGGSQSAGGLEIYYLEQQAIYHAADAYMPFNLTTGSVGDHPVDSAFPEQAEAVGTPILLVNSETDLDDVHYPDTPHYTQWEVAGATHYDEVPFIYNQRLQLRDLGIDLATGDSACTNTPRSRIPFQYVLDSAMDTLVRRLQTGQIPPSEPRFDYNLDGSAMLDQYGNIVGGIRLPHEAAAIATNGRDNGPSFMCYLYGNYAPFTEATLDSLYRSHADYVSKFDTAADAAVTSGVLLPDDAATSKSDAQNASIP